MNGTVLKALDIENLCTPYALRTSNCDNFSIVCVEKYVRRYFTSKKWIEHTIFVKYPPPIATHVAQLLYIPRTAAQNVKALYGPIHVVWRIIKSSSVASPIEL